MYKSDQIIIKQEFDRSIKYLDSRKEKLTVSECLQEIGHLRKVISILVMVFSSITRKRVDCCSKGMSPISSRKIVPPVASSNLPGFPPFLAPVNARVPLAEHIRFQRDQLLHGNAPLL